MKTYVKPAMMALSISANDMLCTCSVKTRDSDDVYIKQLTEWYGSNGEYPGLLDPTDKVFGKNEEDCANVVEAYCKYGPNGMIIFTS